MSKPMSCVQAVRMHYINNFNYCYYLHRSVGLFVVDVDVAESPKNLDT